MSEVKLFKNKEFRLVRTVVIDGEPWFVGLDIAKSLAYQNPSKAVSDHCKRGKMRWLPDSLGRCQQLKVIPEGDLFVALRNVAVNIVPNIGFRSEDYIYGK